MHIDFPQTYCLGAAARRDITPPPGIYHRMWGAANHDRSTGIHRPLTATALALAPQTDKLHGGDVTEQAQVVVAIDQCLLWNREMEALQSSACRVAGLNLNQLHIAFSHTHAVGLMDPTRANLPGGELIASYLEFLARRVGEAAKDALDALAPVRIVYGTGRCALAAHRDFWDDKNELVACGYNPHGPADDTVLVARVVDGQSRTVATLVNYACHATTLGWENTLVSPDYVGAMRDLVEIATGAPCVFLQGASGDLGPRHGYVGDPAVADRNGRELGYAALAALESLGPPGSRFEYTGPVISGATLGTWDFRPLPADELCQKYRWRCDELNVELSRRVDLPESADVAAQMTHWQQKKTAALERGDVAYARDCRAQEERKARQLSRLNSLHTSDTLRIQATTMRLGDAFWLFVAGEHYNVLQRSLRGRFPQHPIIVATITDGWWPGYMPTADTYGKGIYQETVAIVARGSLEKLIDVVGDQLEAWCA